MRMLATATAIFLSGIGLSAAAAAEAAIKKPTHIAAQALEPALQVLARERNLQVVYRSEVVGNLHTPGAAGDLTANEALKQLLNGTGLTFEYLDDKTVTIVPIASAPANAERSAAAGMEIELAAQIAAGSERQPIRLAQTNDESQADAAAGQQPSDTSESSRLEEIVVTAQKRTERLQDVPVPVTAIRAETLLDTNQVRLEDYYSKIPGLTLTVGDGRGMPMLSIRGITSGYTNPTVGVVLDDAPYGASTNYALGAMVPDIDPSELARVEILRGPQGTLYGASSMGGLLNYVTVEPSTESVFGRVNAGLSSVRNGDDIGYNVSGAVNVPLSDTFAVRINGFTRRDPGYIDDPIRNLQGVNEANYEGGRVSALWKPSSQFALKLSALLQESKTKGLSRVDVRPDFADLQQTMWPGTGWLDKRVAAYTANLTAKLGRVDLTSITGYNVNRFFDGYDLTSVFAGASQALFGVTGTPLFDFIQTSKLTQEVRLAMPIGQRFEWLVGGFYTDEDNELEQQLLAQDDSGNVAGRWFDNNSPTAFEEFSVFTNLTTRITDRFDIQIGGRETRIKQTTSGVSSGPLVGGSSISPKFATKDNAFTYLLTPRFKISPDLMVYARLASGYRAGLPNGNLVDAPPASAPDKTKNYELGVKGNVLDRSLAFDLSLYHIDWTGIQMQIIDSLGRGYFTNGSDAKSQGIELSLESRPLSGLTVAGWVSWGTAELSEPFPTESTNFGDTGDRLPYSTRLSGNLSVEHEFPLTTQMTGFAGGSLSYIGDRIGYFRSKLTPERQVLPSYTKTDLRAGVRYESWTANLFVNNVGDKRGVLTGGFDSTPAVGFTFIQPRTVGMSLSKTF